MVDFHAAVLRYVMPMFGFGVVGDRREVRAVLVKSVADLGVGGRGAFP